MNYSYLSDGTKLSALNGSGEGLVYRGPFVYRKGAGNGNSSLTLESAAFGGGRLTPTGAMLYVTDYLGSVRAVVNGKTGELYKASDYSAFGEESDVVVPQYGVTPAHQLATAALPDGLTLRDGYTGKEDQNQDFGTSYTDFGARQYSPALRRWMTPDPLSEKYYDTSPYAFCANNPVNLVDLDGRYFDKSNARKADRYETRIERKADRLDKQAMRKENRGKQVGDLRERSKELHKSAQDIRDMRNDTDTEYRFQRSSDLLTTTLSYLNQLGHVVVNVSAPNMEGRTHEIRHGGQYARNEINLITGENYGVMDEVDAYRAQYSWIGEFNCNFRDPLDENPINQAMSDDNMRIKSVTNINEITPNFVNQIYYNKEYIYPPKTINIDYWNSN